MTIHSHSVSLNVLKMTKRKTASEACSEHELVGLEGMVREKNEKIFFSSPHALALCSLAYFQFPCISLCTFNKSEKMEGLQTT